MNQPIPYNAIAVLLFASPLMLLFQIISTCLLLWQVAFRWAPDRVGATRLGRYLLILGVVVAPNVMLVFSTVWTTAYQEQYGHWFFSLHDGPAGLAMVPFCLAGSAIVWRGFTRRDFGLRSGLHYVALLTMTGICFWYMFTTLNWHLITDDLGTHVTRLASIVPALAGLCYALRAADVKRHEQLKPVSDRSLKVWFSALLLTIVAKVTLAMRFYNSLPVERPAGYGDCFVVSAATRGHSRIVGSEFDVELGRPVNQQWRTLTAFEIRLAADWPAFHRRLRRVYDRVGPAVAGRIRSPFVADVVYVALKPLEWLAYFHLRLAGSNCSTLFDKRAQD